MTRPNWLKWWSDPAVDSRSELTPHAAGPDAIGCAQLDDVQIWLDEALNHDDELREFLEDDEIEVQADGFFKERLRRELWRYVRSRFGTPEDLPRAN